MKKSVTKIGQSIVLLGHTNVINVKISASLIRVVEKISKLKRRVSTE
jgi:ribosomal protein L28